LKRITIIVITLLIASTLYILYKKLGGDQPIVFDISGQKSFTIVGALYSGNYNDRKVEELFVKARTLIENGTLSGDVAVINYGSDERARMIEQFIGILVETPPATLPEGYEVRTLQAKNVVSTYINMHNLVMPRPEDVREGATNLAKKEGVLLDSLTVEVYEGESGLRVYLLDVQ